MHVLTVCYGHPTDPAAFDAYYTSTHAPLAEKIPGMTSFTHRHCASPDGSQPPYYLIAELECQLAGPPVSDSSVFAAGVDHELASIASFDAGRDPIRGVGIEVAQALERGPFVGFDR